MAVLDKHLTGEYLLAGVAVCAVANTFCCAYINTSTQVEMDIEKNSTASQLASTISQESSIQAGKLRTGFLTCSSGSYKVLKTF